MFLGDMTILTTLSQLDPMKSQVFAVQSTCLFGLGASEFLESPEIRDSFAIRTRRLFLAGYRKFGGGA